MPTRPMKANTARRHELRKCSTGIRGFDEITDGGLPKNRITLISGSTGSGKTLMGIDFIVNGAVKFDEPGVFMSFEETSEELYQDVAVLNIDLPAMVSQKK